MALSACHLRLEPGLQKYNDAISGHALTGVIRKLWHITNVLNNTITDQSDLHYRSFTDLPINL